MDAYRTTVDLVVGLAWPSAAVVVLLVFRHQIRERITHSRLRWKRGESEVIVDPREVERRREIVGSELAELPAALVAAREQLETVSADAGANELAQVAGGSLPEPVRTQIEDIVQAAAEWGAAQAAAGSDVQRVEIDWSRATPDVSAPVRPAGRSLLDWEPPRSDRVVALARAIAELEQEESAVSLEEMKHPVTVDGFARSRSLRDSIDALKRQLDEASWRL